MASEQPSNCIKKNHKPFRDRVPLPNLRATRYDKACGANLLCNFFFLASLFDRPQRCTESLIPDEKFLEGLACQIHTLPLVFLLAPLIATLRAGGGHPARP